MRTVLDFFSLTLLRKIAIRYRLINSFVLVSLLPLLIAGVVAYRESSQASYLCWRGGQAGGAKHAAASRKDRVFQR